MPSAQSWGRAAMSGATVAVCAIACQSVLDIEEPKPLAEVEVSGEGGGGGASAGDEDTAGARTMAGDGGQSTSAPGVGAGGVIVNPECEDNTLRCTGESDTTPQICVSGQWQQNTSESEGECETLCVSGECVECVDSAKRCSVCEEGEDNCSQRVPQTCKDGVWESARQPCEHYCSGDGVCGKPASCAAESAALSTNCDGESCCLSLYVPGGEFKRNYSEGGPFDDPSYPAKISPFLLDKFEVTVTRMQEFVAAFAAIDPPEGAGKAPHIADDTGWSRARNVLPRDVTELTTALASCGAASSWVEPTIGAPKIPINCVDFNVAYAFCIWDGGRLPTDAEWNFAAAGGDEQRLRAWQTPLVGSDLNDTFAVYESTAALPVTVGSKPKGNGRWGHADLLGNVAEQVLDFTHELSTEPCNDCVFLTATSSKITRGGAYSSPPELMITTYPDVSELGARDGSIGFRCARDIK